MSKLATAISTAVINTLTDELPSAVAAKFNIDASEFKNFLAEFLKAQMPTKKSSGNTGRKTGYNLYSKEARLGDKSLDFKKIGEMWRALSDAQKKVWNDRAKDSNGASDEEPKKSSEPTSEVPSEEEQDAPKKKGGRKPVEKPIKVSYDKSTKKWMVEGTQYFIESSKNKVIVGKMVDKKQMPLTSNDIADCESNGWKAQSLEGEE